ncbi:AraC family transcriptional regulator ligand-binding domain-containing protein [Variovorax sp. LARHSF232]
MTRPSSSTLDSPVTISVVFVHGLLSGVCSRGLPVDAFLADAGIDPALLERAGARVTADQYVGLFQSLTDRLDDDLLGFLSQPLRRGSFALVVRSAAGEDTLERAMRRAARTFGLLQTDVELQLVQAGSLAGLTLRFANPSIAQRVPLHELLLRVFWRLFAWLAGGKLPVARFDFAFPSPSYASSYGRIFTTALHFEQQQSGFWFDADRLARPVRRDKAAVKAFLADARSNVIVPPRADLISTRVRSHLQYAQPTWPDLAATAEALHMAASTLQKRLAADGTSFQALKDALRRDLAIVRLNTSAVPLVTLANELGFADSAAFQRAFKSWTGSAPGAYRRSGA